MPERKQLTLQKRTCSPNLQLISWLEQRHHTSSSRTRLCQTLNVFILCQTERAECVPKTGSTLCQQHTSVLGIIQSALGCWLCLTFNLSTGDPLWKRRGKKNRWEPAEARHLVYPWTTACKAEESKGRVSKKCSFLFPLSLIVFWFTVVFFFFFCWLAYPWVKRLCWVLFKDYILHIYIYFLIIYFSLLPRFCSLSLCTLSNFHFHWCDFSLLRTCGDPCP